jgi:hypothetical protein
MYNFLHKMLFGVLYYCTFAPETIKKDLDEKNFVD